MFMYSRVPVTGVVRNQYCFGGEEGTVQNRNCLESKKKVMNKTVQAMSGPVQLRVFGAFVRKERQKL